MVKYRRSITILDYILNELYGFCKTDLKIDYYQIKMLKRDKRKNNYKPKYELFKWFIMLFSHTIAHGNLMILTTHILCAFINNFVADYFDDIYSNNLC